MLGAFLSFIFPHLPTISLYEFYFDRLQKWLFYDLSDISTMHKEQSNISNWLLTVKWYSDAELYEDVVTRLPQYSAYMEIHCDITHLSLVK